MATKAEIKQKLRNKRGYYNNGRLKKGVKWLAKHFGVNTDLILDVYADLKQEDKNDEITTPKIAIEVLREEGILLSQPISNRVVDNQHNTINKPGTYWVTGCAHAPFHNKKMYEATFNYLLKETKLEGVILNGDILDMHSISRHNKGMLNPQGVTLDWEYKEASKFIGEIDDMLLENNPKFSSKHYIYGNHEMWHSIALKDVNNAKYGDALKSPLEGLNLINRGYLVQTDYKTGHINFGRHLEINHGEFVNVHSAKKTIDTYRKSVLYNHTHRFQIYMEGQVGGFNIGWGGDDSAPVFNYATRAMKNSWVNASAVVTLDNEGGFHVQPLIFMNNKLIVNGRNY